MTCLVLLLLLPSPLSVASALLPTLIERITHGNVVIVVVVDQTVALPRVGSFFDADREILIGRPF